MYFYLVAFGLLAHVLFWGAGLAMWVMPERWRKFWPVLAVPAGLTLQALVVWLGSAAGLKGTNSYAWWSEAVPVGLLVGAVFWYGSGVARAGARKFWPLWGLTAVVLAGHELVDEVTVTVKKPQALGGNGVPSLTIRRRRDPSAQPWVDSFGSVDGASTADVSV